MIMVKHQAIQNRKIKQRRTRPLGRGRKGSVVPLFELRMQKVVLRTSYAELGIGKGLNARSVSWWCCGVEIMVSADSDIAKLKIMSYTLRPRPIRIWSI